MDHVLLIHLSLKKTPEEKTGGKIVLKIILASKTYPLRSDELIN